MLDSQTVIIGGFQKKKTKEKKKALIGVCHLQ